MKISSVHVISLSVLLMVLAFCYYLLIILPGIKNREVDIKRSSVILEQQRECAKAGEEYNKKIEKELSSGELIMNWAYKYNEELNTCLYRGGVINETITQEYITDLYSNKTVAEYFWNNEKKELIAGDEENFELAVKKYNLEF